jgi:hypothetical protein
MVWLGEITVYPSCYRPVPEAMHKGLSWAELIEVIASPSGPTVCLDKAKLQYFTPGLMHAAPLTGKTLESARAQGLPEVGVMRSAGHVTTSTWLVFDFDGITRSQVKSIGAQVFGKGYSALMYTTHSHGHPDKPGVRMRLVLPVDNRLDAQSYGAAHSAMNAEVFHALADVTGKRLSQQQAAFGVHPARARWAKSWHSDGTPYPLGEFLAKPRDPGNAPSAREAARQMPPALTREVVGLPTLMRMCHAAPFLLATTYDVWSRGLQAFKALAGYYPEGAMRSMAVTFGSTSPSGSKRAERSACDARYEPGAVFDSSSPLMPPVVAAGVILRMAREQALTVVRASIGFASASREAQAAATYLAAHHKAAWSELLKEVNR